MLLTIVVIAYFLVLTRKFDYVLLSENNAALSIELTKETRILQSLLTDNTESGDYTIVNANATLKPIREPTLKYFTEHGYEISKLIDRLFEINKPNTLLPLKSNPGKGYVVSKVNVSMIGTWNWDRWHFFHPHAGCSIELSIPAYDPDTGYILIYSESDCYWTGSGNLILYKYLDNKIVEVLKMNVLIWVN
jgi:hypothetical protein